MGRASDLMLGSGSPEAIALIEGDRELTYSELREAVARRAEELDLADTSEDSSPTRQ